MVLSQIRQEARASLKGKWGKAALLTLCYALISFCISLLSELIPIISIAYVVVSIPISYGISITFIKLKRDEEVSYFDFLTTGFSMFGKIWSVIGNTFLKLIIPFIVAAISITLLIFGMSGSIMGSLYYTSSVTTTFSIVGIIGFIGYFVSIIWLSIKGLLYSLSFFILYDNPDMSGKEIVEKSAEIMNGNRASYIGLQLSFIGWAILSIFTLYIGLLWLFPYIMVSGVIFYEDKIGFFNKEDKQPSSEPEVINEIN